MEETISKVAFAGGRNIEDAAAAGEHLERAGIARRDEIAPLDEDFDGFWISSPASIIHLVARSLDES